MKVETNGDYNSNQLNETINFSPDGKVLSKSLMLNLRGENPKSVWKDYQELKRLVDGKEKKSEKKVKNNPRKQEKQAKKEQKKDNPGTCPKCGAPLIEKQGISNFSGKPYHFFSCGSFPNCRYSKPFVSKAEKDLPSDEDMATLYE